MCAVEGWLVEMVREELVRRIGDALGGRVTSISEGVNTAGCVMADPTPGGGTVQNAGTELYLPLAGIGPLEY
jgi:hypothetical protein